MGSLNVQVSTLSPSLPLMVVLLGWVVMFGPSYYGLAGTVWATEAQGHGPIILCVSTWLLFQKREELAALPRQPSLWLGGPLFVIAALAYALGRSQVIWTLEVGSQNLMIAALLLLFIGVRAVRLAWFPIFFLAFMIPWPGDWIDALTQPLKSAVSAMATSILYEMGYPVGRSGVILTVGPYQLLVADACAGLNSLFSLEALGLLYMNLMRYQSLLRNAALAILIVPISFMANVVRVVMLVLVTYHFGDEAGQGFMHGFAGLALFLVALALILLFDGILGLFMRKPAAVEHGVVHAR